MPKKSAPPEQSDLPSKGTTRSRKKRPSYNEILAGTAAPEISSEPTPDGSPRVIKDAINTEPVAKKRKAKNVVVAADPHATREAGKYDNPIHSREALLALLSEASEPLTSQQIAAQIGLELPDQFEALHRRLRAMERYGQVMVNRRGAYGVV